MVCNTYLQILKEYWGYDSFRGIQSEIIESITSGNDTLGLMPTGGGKSITFQVPALAMEGVCIVITPLIALMNDQVQNLRKRGIKAEAIHSELSQNVILRILENAVFGAIKLLYVSPERLSSELFRTKLRHMKVSFVTIDEAHCISQWGYDFRPSYLRIADIRKDLPNVPILALTATATPLVIDDIQDKLQFRRKCVFRMSFDRSNLVYCVRRPESKMHDLVHILRSVNGSAIIYARTRQRTRLIAKALQELGFQATFYHAGLDANDKKKRQQQWQQDEFRIIVATNAFGMGIDKADVRLVVHFDCPDSLEAYYQEAGRAGRDGKKAYAVLLYSKVDSKKLRTQISSTFPQKDYIRGVYERISYFYEIAVGDGYNTTFEFPIERFCRTYHLFPVPVLSALTILDRAGYIEYHESEKSQARLRFSIERDELYLLRNNTPNEEELIVTLLRNYSGLFSDYVYIDLTVLAQKTGFELTTVYLTLKSLSDKHVVNFIPEKAIPHIRYRQRREDSCHLMFPPNIYDDLRSKYAERIEHIIQYATTDSECRSSLLLKYFGEDQAAPCNHCDVCIARNQE